MAQRQKSSLIQPRDCVVLSLEVGLNVEQPGGRSRARFSPSTATMKQLNRHGNAARLVTVTPLVLLEHQVLIYSHRSVQILSSFLHAILFPSANQSCRSTVTG